MKIGYGLGIACALAAVVSAQDITGFRNGHLTLAISYQCGCARNEKGR